MGVLALLSCRKVIDIDLKLSDQAIVIEAEISDQAGPYTVYVSKAVNISNTNTFPLVTGASVTINDNFGNSELLTETSQGVYKTNTLQGTPGRIYTISVTADGKNYSAVSNMASPVTIDTLTVTTFPMSDTVTLKYINVQFTDPAGIANYYRLVEIVNGVLVNTIYISSDILFGGSLDGYQIEETLYGDLIGDLFGNSDLALKTGDTVKIQLQNIDKNVYEYYKTFNQTSGGGGGAFGSPSPSNPISNLNNGALGYFSAYAGTSKIIIIQ